MAYPMAATRKLHHKVFCKLYGEQAEAEKKGAEYWILTEWPKLLKEFKFSDIYNADETGLYFRAMPYQHTCYRHPWQL